MISSIINSKYAKVKGNSTLPLRLDSSSNLGPVSTFVKMSTSFSRVEVCAVLNLFCYKMPIFFHMLRFVVIGSFAILIVA